jgi:hypothetical protein
LVITDANDIYWCTYNYPTYSYVKIHKNDTNGTDTQTLTLTANTYNGQMGLAVERNNTTAVNSNAIYVVFLSDTSSTTSTKKGNIYKFDLNGTLLWQRQISSGNATATCDISGIQISADGSGVVYASKYINSGVAYNQIIKLSTTGATLFNKNITTAAGTNVWQTWGPVCARESLTYFVGSYTAIVGPPATYAPLVGCLSAAGAISWQRVLAMAFTPVYLLIYGMDVDDTTSVILAGRYVVNPSSTTNSTDYGLVVSLGTNGTVIKWALSVTGIAFLDKIHYSKSQNAIYCMGGAGASSALILKLDTSGNVLWQRLLTIQGSLSYRDIYTGATDTDYFYVLTSVIGSAGKIYKFSADGSRVYDPGPSFTYIQSSLLIAPITVTTSIVTSLNQMTAGTGTMTVATTTKVPTLAGTPETGTLTNLLTY